MKYLVATFPCCYFFWLKSILPLWFQATYHETESKFDITEIFYGDDEDTQLSGCISLAYRALTQRGLQFFKDNREKLFTDHDALYGTNVSNDFRYEGDEHYR